MAAAATAEAKAQYSAMVLGATGNVGGRIVQLLIKNPLCKKVVAVTRRKTDAFADPKVSEVVLNMDSLGIGDAYFRCRPLHSLRRQQVATDPAQNDPPDGITAHANMVRTVRTPHFAAGEIATRWHGTPLHIVLAGLHGDCNRLYERDRPRETFERIALPELPAPGETCASGFFST
jgi:hypothetical protein